MSTTEPLQNRRAIAYIDGFNLYFGLRQSGWQRYYWLDVQRLAASIIPSDTELVATKYFTTVVAAPPEKRKRQSEYIEALQSVSHSRMIYGKYQLTTRFCTNCFYEDRVPNEKMTDVNIAVEIMSDAFQDRFDTALIISGDSDLTPPITAVRNLFSRKQVIVAFPPKRHSDDLARAATSHFTISRTKFRDSQMPDTITKRDGILLRRPERWR